MKNLHKVLILLFATILIYSCGGGTKTTDNTSVTPITESKTPKYSSQVAGFKINFPSTPQEAKDPVTTEAGTFDMYSFVYESGNTTYMVAYVEYPKKMMEGTDPYYMLDNAKQGFIGKLNMTIEKEEKNTENGNSTVQIKAKSTDGYVVLKDILVGSKLYQIAILNTSAYPTDDEVKSFIGSFELQ